MFLVIDRFCFSKTFIVSGTLIEGQDICFHICFHIYDFITVVSKGDSEDYLSTDKSERHGKYFIDHEREIAIQLLIRFKNRGRRRKFNFARLDLGE